MSIYLGIVAKAWNSRLWARGAADLCGPGCHQKGLSTELLTFCVLPSDNSGPPPTPPVELATLSSKSDAQKTSYFLVLQKHEQIWKCMPKGSQNDSKINLKVVPELFFWIFANLDFCNTLRCFCYILKVPDLQKAIKNRWKNDSWKKSLKNTRFKEFLEKS